MYTTVVYTRSASYTVVYDSRNARPGKGNFQCPGCDFFIAIDNDQELMNNEQKIIFWNHVATVHNDLFNTLKKIYSEVAYVPKENQVIIIYNIFR